jgi:hypothetical protein
MKLEEVQTRDKVPTGGPGDFTNRMSTATGWDLDADFTKRVVFASKLSLRLVVPFENAPYMRPLAEPVVEAKKPGPKAA